MSATYHPIVLPFVSYKFATEVVLVTLDLVHYSEEIRVKVKVVMTL